MSDSSAYLDIEVRESLSGYLHRNGHLTADEAVVSRPLTGGVSNRTVWLQRPGATDWVLKQALDKLRVEVDWFSDPRRVHREAAGIRWLSETLPAGQVPELIFEDHAAHLIATTAVPTPHANWKQLLLAGDLNLSLVRQFGQLLGLIHRKGHEERQITEEEFADDTFFETLRLEPYYGYAAKQVPAAAAFLHATMDDTRRNKLTVVHGDYSPKNVLVRNHQIVLIDHEVIHFGDPAFDVGFSLTHFLGKAHHLSTLRSGFAAASLAYWQSYRETLGDVPWSPALESRAVRNTLACSLARVAGRSPLEYLTLSERANHQRVIIELMNHPPATVSGFIDEFVDRL